MDDHGFYPINGGLSFKIQLYINVERHYCLNFLEQRCKGKTTRHAKHNCHLAADGY